MLFYFIFPEIYLYTIFQKYISIKKLEVKQNETSKNLALHQGNFGGTAVKEQKLLTENE